MVSLPCRYASPLSYPSSIESFDHLVGTREQRWRHLDAERLGGLEVNHQFVVGRRLHRKVGGLLALENAVDVAGGAPELVDVISPIGDQTAGGYIGSFGVYCGQLVPRRQRDDQIAMLLRQAARSHDQTTIRRVRERRDGALDLGRVAQVERAYLHPERWRRCLDNAELGRARGYVGIPKDRHARHAWCDLLE